MEIRLRWVDSGAASFSGYNWAELPNSNAALQFCQLEPGFLPFFTNSIALRTEPEMTRVSKRTEMTTEKLVFFNLKTSLQECNGLNAMFFDLFPILQVKNTVTASVFTKFYFACRSWHPILQRGTHQCHQSRVKWKHRHDASASTWQRSFQLQTATCRLGGLAHMFNHHRRYLWYCIFCDWVGILISHRAVFNQRYASVWSWPVLLCFLAVTALVFVFCHS